MRQATYSTNLWESMSCASNAVAAFIAYNIVLQHFPPLINTDVCIQILKLTQKTFEKLSCVEQVLLLSAS
jgi:hypothetical protein